MENLLILVACYLMGSIPFGLIIGKITRGIDIRDFGSGNIGATNVMRTLGVGPAILVFFFDTIKGVAAVLLCNIIGLNPYLISLGALLCVFGHTFSIFLKFKGGKGVATSLGVIIGLNPVIAGIAFGLWAALGLVTRYISVASIVASLSVPLMMIFWKSMPIRYTYEIQVPVEFQILASIAATAIVLKHIPNIKRLVNGTESKIGQKVNIDEGTNEQN